MRINKQSEFSTTVFYTPEEAGLVDSVLSSLVEGTSFQSLLEVTEESTIERARIYALKNSEKFQSCESVVETIIQFLDSFSERNTSNESQTEIPE